VTKPTWLRARTRQPMTNGLAALLAHMLVSQKLNRVSSVKLRRYVRVFRQHVAW